MGIIQLLINEVREDKKKQQVLAEVSDILHELNKGKAQETNPTESEQECNLNTNTKGTERR